MLDATLPADELARAASMFKLLGDPTRARLLFALLEAGELCVCDLAAATGVQEVTVSQSLRMLLDLTREHIAHDQAAGIASAQAIR